MIGEDNDVWRSQGIRCGGNRTGRRLSDVAQARGRRSQTAEDGIETVAVAHREQRHQLARSRASCFEPAVLRGHVFDLYARDDPEGACCGHCLLWFWCVDMDTRRCFVANDNYRGVAVGKRHRPQSRQV